MEMFSKILDIVFSLGSLSRNHGFDVSLAILSFLYYDRSRSLSATNCGQKIWRSVGKRLEWFGLFTVVLIGGTMVGIVTFRNYEIEIANILSLPTILTFASYCLYNSVKDRAPRNRLSPERKLQRMSTS
jgi:hypothetical protein